MSKVLVLDGHHRSALTIARSLGRSSTAEITVGAPARYFPGVLSRHTGDAYIHPPLDEDPDGFVEDLVAHLEASDYDAVMPVSDPTSLVCSKHYSDLEATGTAVGVEQWPTFIRTYDKIRTASLAEDLDVPTPTTRAPDSVDALDDISDIGFPQVVKPRSKSRWTTNEGMSLDKVTDANYVTDMESLKATFASMAAQISDSGRYPLLQKYVDGEIRDTSVLAEGGEIVSYMQNRRVRTYPRSGGGYTLVESLHSEEMLTYAERLVAELNWTGPVNFEYIYDGDTHVLVEINGRYWGSLALATNCGIDIPFSHYQQLVGDGADRDAIDRGSYRDGVRQRWLLPGDLLWLIETVEEGAWSDIGGFATSFVTADHDIPSVRDPLPTLGSLAHMTKLGYDVLTGRRTRYGE